MSESNPNSTKNYSLNFKAVERASHHRRRKKMDVNLKSYSPVYMCYPALQRGLGGSPQPRTAHAANTSEVRLMMAVLCQMPRVSCTMLGGWGQARQCPAPFHTSPIGARFSCCLLVPQDPGAFSATAGQGAGTPSRY